MSARTLRKRIHCFVLIAPPSPLDVDGLINVFITNIELLILSNFFQSNLIGRTGNTIRVPHRSRLTNNSSLNRLLFINAMSDTNVLKTYRIGWIEVQVKIKPKKIKTGFSVLK